MLYGNKNIRKKNIFFSNEKVFFKLKFSRFNFELIDIYNLFNNNIIRYNFSTRVRFFFSHLFIYLFPFFFKKIKMIKTIILSLLLE